MAKHPRVITVRTSYIEDARYREKLRRQFRQKYLEVEGGRSPFFNTVMRRAFDRFSGEMRRDDGEKFTPNLDSLEDNLKRITDYVSLSAKHKTRRFDVGFLRIIDAFMQIKDAGFDRPFQDSTTSDSVGEILGGFLKDPSSDLEKRQLGKNANKILGIYEYKEVNTHQKFSGSSRIVAFISRDTIDYLKVIDFMLRETGNKFEAKIQYRDVVSGFCIPGDEFSPLIMRSLTYQTRHLGLLYTAGNLVDMDGGLLDDLIYEVFTTNQRHKGSAFKSEKYKNDPLIAKALDIHYGPRLRRNLQIVTNIDRKNSLLKIISNIEMTVL